MFTRMNMMMMVLSIAMLLLVVNVNARQIGSNTSNAAMQTTNSVSASGMSVIAYYPEFGDVNPTPAQIDWTAFTHIVIFTTEATKNPPYYFRELPGSADSGYFDGGYNKRQNWCKAIVDGAHANGVKAIMCLGGEVGTNASNFSYMIADPARRAAYISYVTGFARRRNIDGFDIDHEFTSGTEGASLVAFFTELRAANPNAWISTAVPLWACPAYYNFTSFYNGSTVDAINIMAYREADGSSIVGFNSPLYQPKTQYPNYNGGSWLNNPFGQGPKYAWIDKGISASKLGMIIPFEGAKIDGNDAPGQFRSGWVQFSNYSTVVAAKASGAVEHWDNEAKVPWLGYTDGSGKHFLSYENQASIQAKVDACVSLGIRNLGIWELFRGYATNASRPDELLQFVKQSVGGTGTPPPPDITKPTVSITSPLNGAIVSGTIVITATASDNVGVTKVDLKVNGVAVVTDVSSPYSYSWNTIGLSGNQSLSATAYDAAGNQASSTVVTVTVTTPPPPNTSDNWLYQDALQPPWRDTSWNSTNTFNSTTQVYSGLYSLKASQIPWAAVSMRSGPLGSPVDVNPGLYSKFEFAVYNTTPGLILNVYCYNDRGDVFPNVLQNNVPMNQWTIISVPMTQLDPNGFTIHRVNIQNYTRLNPTFYIDNVRFVANVPIIPPPPMPVLLSPVNGALDITISPTLTWNVSAGAASYQIQIASNAGFTMILLDDSALTATSRQVNSLTNITTYYWRVNAKNATSTSSWSSVSSFTTIASQSVDNWLYQDALQPPWRDTSWNSTNTFNSTTQVYSGLFWLKASQIPWAAISMRSGPLGSPVDVNPGLYSKFEFAVYNTTPGLILNVYCYNDRGDAFPNVLQNNVPVNQWTIISVPMTQLDPNGFTIHRVNVQNYTRLNPTFYIDNVRFVGAIQSAAVTKTLRGAESSPGLTAAETPREFTLKQNYPNPFNPTTQLDYQLTEKALVTLTVYDILGNEVSRLVEGGQEVGYHTAVWNAGASASGIYFARLSVTDFSGKALFQQMKRMTLIK